MWPLNPVCGCVNKKKTKKRFATGADDVSSILSSELEMVDWIGVGIILAFGAAALGIYICGQMYDTTQKIPEQLQLI